MSISEIAEEVFAEEKAAKIPGILEFLEILLKSNKVTPFFKEVKAQKLGGVIYLPKKFVGKRVLIVVENED